MTLELIRGLYDYHWWANRRLWDVAAALGEETAARAVGTQFSFPTLKGMFAHIFGADFVWWSRWTGRPPERLPADGDFATLAALRQRWDAFEKDQRAFIQGLREADLTQVVEYRSALFGNRPFTLALWPLLQHVANHATHHRSEIATMLTMLSGSPPSTDLVVYQLTRSGQI